MSATCTEIESEPILHATPHSSWKQVRGAVYSVADQIASSTMAKTATTWH